MNEVLKETMKKYETIPYSDPFFVKKKLVQHFHKEEKQERDKVITFFDNYEQLVCQPFRSCFTSSEFADENERLFWRRFHLTKFYRDKSIILETRERAHLYHLLQSNIAFQMHIKRKKITSHKELLHEALLFEKMDDLQIASFHPNYLVDFAHQAEPSLFWTVEFEMDVFVLEWSGGVQLFGLFKLVKLLMSLSMISHTRLDKRFFTSLHPKFPDIDQVFDFPYWLLKEEEELTILNEKNSKPAFIKEMEWWSPGSSSDDAFQPRWETGQLVWSSRSFYFPDEFSHKHLTQVLTQLDLHGTYQDFSGSEKTNFLPLSQEVKERIRCFCTIRNLPFILEKIPLSKRSEYVHKNVETPFKFLLTRSGFSKIWSDLHLLLCSIPFQENDYKNDFYCTMMVSYYYHLNLFRQEILSISPQKCSNSIENRFSFRLQKTC